MRGPEVSQSSMFSYMSIEDRIPQDHPLRAMRRLLDPVLADMSPRFAALYSRTGRPSIPPEQLLRALLLQILYTIRSERQLMEQLDYNLLFRWFVGLNPDDAIWVPTVFTKNRDRLLEGDIADAFFNAVLKRADANALLSHEHFTVDGTLLEAWASHKSFRPIDEQKSPPPDGGSGGEGSPVPASSPPSSNPQVNFRGEKRSNVTHRSVTDPDARLARKSHNTTSMLCYQASVVTENRHGLIVQTDVRAPSFDAERDAALEMLTMLEPGGRRPRRSRTLGADKGYDTNDFVDGVRALGFTPHVSPNVHGRRFRSTIDGRTLRHAGFAISQRKRKLVEEGFGWGKVVGVLRKLHHRGRDLVSWIFTFTSAAYNLVRLRRLLEPIASP
jgi:transposase